MQRSPYVSLMFPLMCLLPVAAAGCSASSARTAEIRQVALSGDDADRRFEALRADFAANNPGYDLRHHRNCRQLDAAESDRVVFVQGPAAIETEPTVGDVLLLRAGESWRAPDDRPRELVAFAVPEPLPKQLPAIVRPDWDPNITDTPGGCATEGDAYRRILLTWWPEVGPYVMHQLNAHRVRITDSFSHYHPVDGGFDEFYLVQQVPAAGGATLLTSQRTAAIEARDVSRAEAADLLQSRELHVGDLIYMPRGTVHRGLGGAVVQVISVPGFVPKSEIGVDHHLWAINRQLELEGDERIPFHLVAARTAVVK